MPSCTHSQSICSLHLPRYHKLIYYTIISLHVAIPLLTSEKGNVDSRNNKADDKTTDDEINKRREAQLPFFSTAVERFCGVRWCAVVRAINLIDRRQNFQVKR